MAINLASLSFMIPLSISIAASVRVGLEIGAGRGGSARGGPRRARSARRSCRSSRCCSSWFPVRWPGLYADDVRVVTLAATLLRLAAAFQVFDGVQVVASGVLRGAGETRAPMLMHFAGFWAIGVPLGAWLAFATPLGARGLWIGLIAGLGSVAVVLVIVVHRRFGKDLVRLRDDA